MQFLKYIRRVGRGMYTWLFTGLAIRRQISLLFHFVHILQTLIPSILKIGVLALVQTEIEILAAAHRSVHFHRGFVTHWIELPGT